MNKFVATFAFANGEPRQRRFIFGEFHQLQDIIDGSVEHGWGKPIDMSELEKVEITITDSNEPFGEVAA